jgi:hypothetical protein
MSGGRQGRDEGSNVPTHLDEHSAEEISVLILGYLKTGMSPFFPYEPDRSREAPILDVFESSSSELLRNNIRKAVAMCIARESAMRDGASLITMLLNLAEETRADQAQGSVAKLAMRRSFAGLGQADLRAVKRRLIGALMRLSPRERLLCDVLEYNLADPIYTDVCMSLAAGSSDGPRRFLESLPLAYAVYERNRNEVDLPGVVRMFIQTMGVSFWTTRGSSLILSAEGSATGVALDVLKAARLEPIVRPLDIHETLFEVSIRWPYSTRRFLSTEPFLPTSAQRDGLLRFWIECMQDPQAPTLDALALISMIPDDESPKWKVDVGTEYVEVTAYGVMPWTDHLG